MNFEHEQAKRGLDRIRAALQGLEAAPGADGQAAALKPRFTRLRDDMLEHIRAEEEDLFPRAVELEGRVMELLQKALGED
jgi:iron-sulfur cluster repair protein YtfE (RIC family)